MKPNWFDVLKEMSARNMDIKGFPQTNLKSVSSGGKKGWGSVTIAIDRETAVKIMTEKKIVFALLVGDASQFEQVEKELKEKE